MATADSATIPVEDMTAHAFEIPTDGPDGWEQDGTLTWSSTVLILVEARAAGSRGIGYTYGDVSVAALVESKLASAVTGADALAPPAAWRKMSAQLRNAGQPGPGAMAMSAVDIALWDLKARLLDQPLYRVLPTFRDEVAIYGSGGFTNYPLQRLTAQVSEWAAQGIPRMKIKTSRHPDADPARLTAVRKEAGDGVELFTDANGALTRKSALYWRNGSPASGECAGSRSRSARRTPKACGCCATAGLPGLISRPGSTGTCCPISPRCWTPGRWTACRLTSPGAAGSLACFRWAAWPRPARWSCPGTARPR